MRKLITALAVLLFAVYGLNAQTLLHGTVLDAEYNNPLPGASVVVKGTNLGTLTDMNGDFTLKVNESKVVLQISFVGYHTKELTIETGGRKELDLGTIYLKPATQEINEIYVVAERASEQRTPVAISNIERKKIEYLLGSQDLPMVMNVTPSVYATEQGGGSGDARINVRGFDQRNVAIMINGVPVNDMENGWVYWSNWDGIADATSSIQLQRGLSAVNLAVPSVGGTINIVTSPAAKKRGGIIKTEATMFSGLDGLGFGMFKTTVTGHTGLINNKFALSASLVRKFGPGIIDATWTDAWAYYFGMTYKINDKNKIELFALGAPQRHGQNLYQQNLAAYSAAYAKALHADDSTLKKFPQSQRGRFYNENWNKVDPNYDGLQFWNGKTHKRHAKDFINERENYYHKPLVNLNIYNHFSDNVSLFTVLYYSGGKGGGSGTYGHVKWDYTSEPSRIADWNGTIAANQAAGHAVGILRNSVNQQWTLGLLSKLRILFNDNLKANFGIDGRYAQISHFREVRDLLGAQDFIFTGDQLHPNDTIKKLGDKIAYYFTNTVEWMGYYGQVEYSNQLLTAYLTLGNSFVKYAHRNHFVEDPNNPGHELFLQSKFIPGYQVKTGLSLRPIEGLKTYVNVGYISKAPIFDNVISDRTHALAPNPKNEKFESAEIGAIYKYQKFADLRVNYYYTLWKDRAISILTYNQQTNKEELIFLTGLNELHQGVELEAYLKPIDQINFNFAASFANWVYLNDVEGQYSTYDDQTGEIDTLTKHYYIKGLKVGDAPQKQFMGSIIVKPVTGLRLELVGRYYTDYYAKFEPTSRTNENDTAQVWKVPPYYLLDAHLNYVLPLKTDKFRISVFGHVFNILNALYISDATDNSRWNGFYGYDHRFNHDVNTASVFVGLPRTMNFGLRVEF